MKSTIAPDRAEVRRESRTLSSEQSQNTAAKAQNNKTVAGKQVVNTKRRLNRKATAVGTRAWNDEARHEQETGSREQQNAQTYASWKARCWRAVKPPFCSCCHDRAMRIARSRMFSVPMSVRGAFSISATAWRARGRATCGMVIEGSRRDGGNGRGRQR